MDSLIKPYNDRRASFGRHETFSLRYAWLTKGFQAFMKKKAIFSSDEATIELGVGKNMVNAIKYWLRACSMLEENSEGLEATELGTALFSEKGWDQYLEDEATLWLIHWLLATNFETSTAWYWFFNCFHKTEFTQEEAADALVEFVQSHLKSKHSEKTVRQEIAMILRMYTPPKVNSKSLIEEHLDAPLTALNLVNVSESAHFYRSFASHQPNIPIGVIGFAVNELLNQRRLNTLPISELMYGQKYGVALGSLFRLTESALIAKLERLIKKYPTVFQINETAGINQLYRGDSNITSIQFLRDHYQTEA
jgi:hypothetical protein